MIIRIADHERDADYIRHARVETLKALHVKPTPSMANVLPFAKYVLLHDERTERPIGMAESAMLGDAYGSYEDTPYSDLCDLDAYCPLSQMAGMRTVFVEPEYRTSNLAFLTLIIGSAKLFHGIGARFATASTRSADEYLNRLYKKCGGEPVGTFQAAQVNEPSSLFVFDLERLINHRAMRRIARYVAFDFDQELAAV